MRKLKPIGHIDYKDRSDLVNDVAKSLGFKIDRFLGNGCNGYAYLLTNGKVLKLTAQQSEVALATHIIGKKFKHYNRIEATYHIGWSHNFDLKFAIIGEFLDTETRFEQLRKLDEDSNVFFYSYFLVSEGKIDKCLSYFTRESRRYPRHKQALTDIFNLVVEAIQNKLPLRDFNIRNIGYRGKDLVLFDLGYSDIILDDNKLQTLKLSY